MEHTSTQQGKHGGGAATATLAGIAFVVLANFSFSLLDATAKYLSGELPILQIVWVRFLSHAVITLFLFRVWMRPRLLIAGRPILQIVRALCLLGTTFFNFLALRYLQLDQTTSIMFAAPFVITAMAGPILGEWAGPRRWAAIVVGFIGVLIVTQPGADGLQWPVIYSIISMLLYATYALMTRHLAGSSDPATMLLIPGLVAAAAMTPVGVSTWVQPEGWWTWTLLVATGVFGGGGHYLFIRAHKLASASMLAPFMYFQIVWMITLGFLVFGDVPSLTTLIGVSIVVLSGLYILYREGVRKG